MAVQLKKFLPIFIALSFCAPLFAHASVISIPANNIGLAGYWNFNEGSGSVAHDTSGSGVGGTISGSPAWVTGKFGKALQFTSTSQYVTTGYTIPAQSSATSFTWAAWVNLTSSGGTQVLLGFRNGATWMKLTPSSFEYSNGGLISYTLPTNRWTQVIIVKNGTSFTYYVNGVVVGTGSSAASVISHTFLIGSDPGFSDGTPDYSIDDVRVYSRALSATEAAELYQTSAGQFTSLDSNGLKGYWNFNEDKGSTANDFISTGPSGSIVGSPSWIMGKQGYALSFNGTSQYVDVPMTVNYPTFTVSAWINAASLSNGSYNPRIVANSHTDSDNKGFQLMFNNGGASGFFDVGNGSSEGRAAWSQALSTGTWYNYVGVYDGSHVYAYINGVQVASTAYAGGSIAASTGYDVTIGRANGATDTTDYFDGTIDDVRIYNRALPANEVAALYSAAIPSGKVTLNESSATLTNGSSLQSGLVGLWTFDGKDMLQNVKDDSGQVNTGYLIGFTSTTSAETIGKLGQALLFAGGASTDEVRVPNASSLNPSAVTVSAWIYSTGSDPSSNSERIVDKANSGTISQNGFRMEAFTASNCGSVSPEWGFQWYNGSPQLLCGPIIASTTNKWTNIVFTHDGTTANIYSNGVLVNSLTASYTGSNTFNFVIGNSDQTTKPFTGKLDDVRVYSRALSASEVTQLYNLGH